MHNETLRRCYLYMVLLALICLLTLLYTTKIVNLTTLSELNTICASKFKLKAWLQEISSKQDLTNMKLYSTESDQKSSEFLTNFKLWNDRKTDYGLAHYNFEKTKNPVALSSAKADSGVYFAETKYNEELRLNVDEGSRKEPKNDIEALGNFSKELEVDKMTTMQDKRSVTAPSSYPSGETLRAKNEDVTGMKLAVPTNNMQSTPLRFRKYGEDWLMTKDELSLLRHWCIERDYRINWNRILEPCKGSTAWFPYKPYWSVNNVTTGAHSYVFGAEIRPSGQYSTFYIQSVAQDGTKRRTGGDSWRVHIKGSANVPVTIMDHNTGVYEVFFLVTEPGKYEAEIVLDFTLCDGMKDPPVDWFIKGNIQGKYQHPDALPGKEHPYLLESLPNEMKFTVQAADVSIFEDMKENGLLEKYCPNPSCMIWDGYGAWVDNVWKEYLSARKERDPTDRRDGTLWIYGDSVGDLFYKSIAKRALCHELFDNCNHTYNWVYALQNMNITQAKVEWDNQDFSISRIISELDDVISNPIMNDHSVMILNMGLHYVQGVNFTSYRKLIEGVIDLLSSHKKSPHGFHGKVIWKTTTALFKERYGDPKTGARHAKGLRFLTVPRLQLFNAYATSTMCNNGFDILDVYPISDSYPGGTGGVKKQWDAVHFDAKAFKPVEDLLEEYLG